MISNCSYVEEFEFAQVVGELGGLRAAANGCLTVIPEIRVSGKYGTCLNRVPKGGHDSGHNDSSDRSKVLVGATGFEPATPCTPCKCATRLRHAPTEAASVTAKTGVRYPSRRVRDQRRRSLRMSSSSALTWRMICWLCVVSLRASSPMSRWRAPPMVKPSS